MYMEEMGREVGLDFIFIESVVMIISLYIIATNICIICSFSLFDVHSSFCNTERKLFLFSGQPTCHSVAF